MLFPFSFQYNSFVPISSYLCNCNIIVDNKYILFDYLIIYLLCSSYINISYINIILFGLLIYEYKKYNTIDYVKSLTYILAVTQANINTYFLINNVIPYFYIIFSSSITSLIIFQIRRYLYIKKIYTYNTLLTYIWHVCIMNTCNNILYVCAHFLSRGSPIPIDILKHY